MFDINNSRDFYQKLLEDFDDYMQHQDSARHAMNCAITAHHMADWVWGDFIKDDHGLKAKLGVKDIHEFRRWIDTQSIWYSLVQSISNGSKHFIRGAAEGTHKIEGFGMGGYAREIEPDFPVVYMSGAAAADWRSKGVPHSIMLAKPFAPAQLLTAISNLLNSGTPTAAP